ncbi:MAG: hypothetical protein QXI33_01650 [Candidatus Pacearchaeota archaeon]
MKKEGLIFLILVIVLAGLVVAQSFSNSGIISENEEKYIKEFINKTGIVESDIKNIEKVDQSGLPNDIDIKKIDENKVGIYEVNYTKNNESKKVFVVTYSSNEFKKLEDKTKNIQTLFFGYSGILSSSSYLESSSGVKLNENLGYVMLRSGSVTGISTSLEIPEGEGDVYIRVYKNGEDTGFGNLISSSDSEKIDFDIQSEGIVSYKPGDIISVYVSKGSENIKWGNVVTSVELTN